MPMIQPRFVLVGERLASDKPHGRKRNMFYVLEAYDTAPNIPSLDASKERYAKLGYVDVNLYQKVSIRGM